VVAYAKAVACELPRTRGVPLGRWSLAELRAELLASGLVSQISTTTLWRWLAEDPIKPWQHHSWIFPRDPEFAAKATIVLDLYQRVFAGVPLGEGYYVINRSGWMSRRRSRWTRRKAGGFGSAAPSSSPRVWCRALTRRDSRRPRTRPSKPVRSPTRCATTLRSLSKRPWSPEPVPCSSLPTS
jgi:hypothetical protein